MGSCISNQRITDQEQRSKHNQQSSLFRFRRNNKNKINQESPINDNDEDDDDEHDVLWNETKASLLATNAVELKYNNNNNNNNKKILAGCSSSKKMSLTVKWFDRPSGFSRPVQVYNGLWKLNDRLIKLTLSDFPYTRLPDEIGNLTNLTRLALVGSEASWSPDVLREIPAAIGRLMSLEELVLQGCNQLETLPPEFGQLQNLQKLEAFRCSQLRTLPKEIGQLSANLKQIELVDLKSFQDLPKVEFGLLASLESLVIAKCQSFSKLPTSIGNLQNLQSLCVSSGAKCGAAGLRNGAQQNGWSIAIPVSLWQCHNLKVLDLSNMPPEPLSDFFEQSARERASNPKRSNLQKLYMRDCGLTDKHLSFILRGLPSVERLQLLDLSRNRIASLGPFLHVGLPQSIACLELTHNPVLWSLYPIEQRNLIALLGMYRQLGTIADIRHGRTVAPIFTPEILHLLFVNKYAVHFVGGNHVTRNGGNNDDNPLPPLVPLWPMVLEKIITTTTRPLVGDNSSKGRDKTQSKNRHRRLGLNGVELQASVIYSLLEQGLPFLISET